MSGRKPMSVDWNSISMKPSGSKALSKMGETAYRQSLRSMSDSMGSSSMPLPIMKQYATEREQKTVRKEIKFSSLGKPRHTGFRHPMLVGDNRCYNMVGKGGNKDRRRVKTRVITDDDTKNLQNLNGKYYQTTISMIATSGRARGKRVLILGCGKSKQLSAFLRLGAAEVLYTDNDERCIEVVQRMIDEKGRGSVAGAVLCDLCHPGDVLPESKKYDLIIALKCIGQALANKTDTKLAMVLGRWDELLAPGGCIIVDNLKKAEALNNNGRKYSHVFSADTRNFMVATSCGKFDDVVYNVRMSADRCGMYVEFKWYPAGFNKLHEGHLGYQEWEQFVLMKCAEVEKVVKVYQPKTMTIAIKRPFFKGQLQTLDTKCNSVSPPGANGIKVPYSREDHVRFKNQQLLPKLDGFSCMLLLDDNNLVVFSPQLRKVVCHRRGVGNHKYVFKAEVMEVFDSPGVKNPEDLYILGIIGLIEVDGEMRNVNDHSELNSIAHLVPMLAEHGVFLSNNIMCSTLKGNFVSLAYGGTRKYLKVDGINTPNGDEYGRFIKPFSLCTIDSTVEGMLEDVPKAFSLLFGKNPEEFQEQMVLVMGEGHDEKNDIFEFQCTQFPHTWKPIRKRFDKSRPATLARVTQDVLCAACSFEVEGGVMSTVEDMMAKIV